MLHRAQRFVLVVAIPRHSYVRVILADIRAGQHIVAEIHDIRSVAAVVLLAEIENFRFEPLDEGADACRIGAAKLIDALLGIRKGDQAAMLAERRDHPPLVGVGGLKLVKNDNRIAIGQDSAEARALLQKIGGQASEEIESEQALFGEKPLQ